MSLWDWRKIDENNWRLDDHWAVQKDWASGRWYAVRDGAYCLSDFATVAEAIAEAERLREEDNNYK